MNIKFMLLMTLVSFLQIANLKAQGLEQPPAGKAYIYVVRHVKVGLAINFQYYVGDRYIGKFNAPKYLRFECDPGKHVIWAKSENRSFVEVEAEAGKIYLIDVGVQMGMAVARVNLIPVLSTDIGSKRYQKAVKLINKKAPELISNSTLVASNEEKRDAANSGMERYYSLKESNEHKIKKLASHIN